MKRHGVLIGHANIRVLKAEPESERKKEARALQGDRVDAQEKKSGTVSEAEKNHNRKGKKTNSVVCKMRANCKENASKSNKRAKAKSASHR